MHPSLLRAARALSLSSVLPLVQPAVPQSTLSLRRALRAHACLRFSVVLSSCFGGVAELAAQIPPRPPTIVRHPESKHTAIGYSGSVQFEVGADGWPAPKYEWFKDGVLLPGRTTEVLQLQNFTFDMAGVYTARAYNDHGSVMSNGATLTVHDLQITRQPESQSAVPGSTVTFSMEVSSTDPVTYEWHGPNGRIAGATGPTLTIVNVQAHHAGKYFGYVSSAYGQRGTPEVWLTVNSPPVFTQPPRDTYGTVGGRAVISGYVIGPEPFTFVWRKNGAVVAGATDHQLIFPSAQRSDEGSYTLTVSNAFGSITSAPVNLSVVGITLIGPREKVYDGQPLTLSATTDPAGLPVEYRYTATNGYPLGGPPVQPGFYRVHATVNNGTYFGSVSADLRILAVTTTPTILGLQQVYDGKPKIIRASVPNGDRVWPEYINVPFPQDAGVYPFRLRLADGSALTLDGPSEYLQVVEKAPQALSFAPLPATLTVGSAFSVAATSTSDLPVSVSIVSGNATLNGTQLTLHDAAPVTLRASQPGDRNHHAATETLVVSTAKQSQTITFAALPDRLLTTTPLPLSATASSGLPVAFEIAGGPATISGGSLVFTGYEGVVHVRAVQSGNATYNAAASVVRSFSVLTAQRPFITAQPVSRTVQLDQPVNFSVGATAPGPLAYVWMKNGKALGFGNPPTPATLTLNRPSFVDAGAYSVAVFHGSSCTLTNAATLTVTFAPNPDAVAPVITDVTPSPQAFQVGSSPSLLVSHTGVGVVYQWFKDGAPIPGATREWFTGIDRTFGSRRFLPEDAGTYHVTVSNSAGTATSSPIVVTVAPGFDGLRDPIILDVTPDTPLAIGATLTLSVNAIGDSLTYRWSKNGAWIAGATGTTYTIANAQLADSGIYGVIVENGTGQFDSKGIRIAVRSGNERGAPFAETPPPGSPDGSGPTGVAPAIVARPLDGGYDPGTRVVLSVTAEGTAPLTYQWRRETVPIPGATDATLVFPSIQTSDAGYYTVEVSNAFGQTAATARIQVSSGPPSSPNTPPAITRQPTAQTAAVGGTAIFTVDVTGSQPLSFQWRKNGVPLADGRQQTLTLYNVQSADAGNYEVSIVNPLGGVTSVPAALTVTSTPPPPPPTGTWLSQAIGGATPAGSANESGGTVTLQASGADIWDVSDAFHFRYQSLSGNGEIVARVTRLDETHSWAKAGVMIRESLEPGARNVMALVNAHFVALLQSRVAPNATTSLGSAHWASAPRWLRLVRAGNTLAGFHSDDGTNWISLGSIELSLPSTVLIGLAATSHVNGTLTTAVFDHVTISGTATEPPPPSPPAQLPAPSNLVATPLSSSAISLAWVDASADETGFELQRSSDGASFTTFLTVGAGVTSATSTGLAPATLYSFRVRAQRSATTSAFSNIATASTLSATSPPAPPAGTWQSSDIGGVALSGSTTESGGVISVSGSGADIWESGDEFRFRHQPWNGDGEIIVRVTGLTHTHAWAKAGLMFREDLSASSRHVLLALTPSFGVVLQRRAITAGASESTSGAGVSSTPRWLRLARAGDTFTGYESADGASWTQVGTVTVPLSSALFAGLAVTSHNDGVLATATFDNLALNGGGAPPLPPATLAAPTNLSATATSSTTVALSWTDNASSETGYEIERSTDNATFVTSGTAGANATSTSVTGLSPLTTYYFRVRAVQGTSSSFYSLIAVVTTPAAPPPSQPAAWNTLDVGTVAATGSASESGGIVTLQGSGADIWDFADAFRFRYQSLAADGEIVARITALTNTHPWAKAGVMLRESLDAGSRHALLCITPGNGVAFQRRTMIGGGSESTNGTNSSALPRWLRLVRSGATITAYESTSGTSWTPIGSVTFGWSGALHVGLAVTSHNDGTLATAMFDNVTVTGGTTSGSTGPSAPPPSTAVSAPSNLVATAVSSTQVDLTWADNSDNETDFRLERSTDNAAFTLIPPERTPRDSTRYSDTGLTPGTTYYYRIRALGSNNTVSGYSNTTSATTLLAPTPPPPTAWSNTDVGAVGVTGSIETGTTSITIRGSGVDIWENADAFRFLYRTLPGDCVVEAQVASIGNTHPWAKAGVMIRESLAPGARNVFLALTPSNGLAFQQRQIAGEQTYFSPGPWGAAAPYWVRLVRTGNQIAAYVSPNGATWTQLSIVSFPSGSALVGFAVTSHDNAQLTTAVFNDPSIQ